MAKAGVAAGFTSSGGTTALSDKEYFQRLAGSKVAKEVALLAKRRNAAIRAQARATKNISAAMREKAQLLNDQVAMQLFTFHASQITKPDAMEYFNLKRKYELHQMCQMVADIEQVYVVALHLHLARPLHRIQVILAASTLQ